MYVTVIEATVSQGAHHSTPPDCRLFILSVGKQPLDHTSEEHTAHIFIGTSHLYEYPLVIARVTYCKTTALFESL